MGISMTSSSEDRVVLVFGGASGLGEATALAAARAGASVALADRDVVGLESVSEAIKKSGGTSVGLPCDVTEDASVKAAVDGAQTELGGIDVLVNCAGIAHPEPSASITDSEWNELVDTHVSGTMRCVRAAFPALKASPSASVVNMSSVHSQFGVSGRLSYCAAKGAIEAMTRVLAVEWAAYGIRVNAISPGYILTPMLRKLIASGDVDERLLLARVPLGRFGAPEDIAAVIMFLASEQAGYLTGQTLIVDGGRVVNGDH
jgi:NAD(P)-dependent dehydrogenase (short-subunit alcohol dehydrogenase family)